MIAGLPVNPETAKRRHVRAAYRQVNDPRTELHKLKKVLGKFVPPKDWKEQQKARYRALPIFEGINWDLIDGAETVAARRRRVATATKKNA